MNTPLGNAWRFWGGFPAYDLFVFWDLTYPFSVSEAAAFRAYHRAHGGGRIHPDPEGARLRGDWKPEPFLRTERHERDD